MTPQSDRERQDAVERAIRHYPDPLVDARELTEAVLEETDSFDELADPRREVLEVLRVLERTGDVVSHRPGANAITWAHVDRVIRDAPPRDPADHPDQSALEEARDRLREDAPGSVAGREAEHAPGADGDLRAEVLDYFRDGEPPKARTAREALATVATILNDRGRMETGDLRSAVYERHADEYSDEKSMWASISEYLKDFPYVRDPGRGEWSPDRP